MEIDLGKPGRRLAFHDAIRQYAGIESASISSRKDAVTVAAQAGLGADELAGMSAEAIIGEIFDKRVESHLIEPTFIMDYPAALCPLTKRHRDNPALAERFEPFIAGVELGNAFSELSDPAYQAEQFAAQRERALQGDEEVSLASRAAIRGDSSEAKGAFCIGREPLGCAVDGCQTQCGSDVTIRPREAARHAAPPSSDRLS